MLGFRIEAEALAFVQIHVAVPAQKRKDLWL